MTSWSETSEVTPENNERIQEGGMFRDAYSERVCAKRGVSERSDDPWDPPKLLPSE